MASQRILRLLMFVSILIISFLSLVHSTDVPHDEEVNKEFTEEDAKKLFDEEIKELLKEMGLQNLEILTLENFKQILVKFITRDQPIPDEEKALFEKLMEKMTEGVSETFPMSDLGKYLDVSKISTILNELMGNSGMPNMQMNPEELDAGDEEIEDEESEQEEAKKDRSDL